MDGITKGPIRWWGPMKITKKDREETKMIPEQEPKVEIKIPDSSSNLPI